jgi:hypothetical protein
MTYWSLHRSVTLSTRTAVTEPSAPASVNAADRAAAERSEPSTPTTTRDRACGCDQRPGSGTTTTGHPAALAQCRATEPSTALRTRLRPREPTTRRSASSDRRTSCAAAGPGSMCRLTGTSRTSGSLSRIPSTAARARAQVSSWTASSALTSTASPAVQYPTVG